MADFGRRFGEFWPEFEDLLTTDDLKKLMGPKGPLSAWEQFENRPEQIQMALEVQRAMDDDDLTIIEAGTGTGKTLAYLLPALLSEKTTVVSTGLKNLQDQIYQKDIVFLKKFFKFDFNVAIIKGRDNYVCRRLLSGRGANARPLLEDQGWKKNLIDWALDAVTGLLEDIPKELSQQIPKTAKISSSRESCRGRSCLFFRRCFYYGNIARAAKSQIILVNHNIFVIDLNLKTGGDSEGRGIIPEWDAAILDEAHLLEGVATDCLGYHFDVNESLKTFDQLMDLFEKGAFSESPEALAVLEACEEITELLNALPTRYDETFSERELYPNDTPQNRARNQELKALFNDISEKTEALTRKLPSPKAGEQNPLPQRDIALALAQAKAAAEAADEPADATGADPRPVSLADYADEFIDQPDEERIDIFQRKLAEIVEVTSFLGDHSDETFVYQVSVKGSGPEKGGKKSKKEAGIKVTFAALPLEAGRILGHKLKGVKKTIVITSATLSTGGDFAYFKNRFDLEPETPSMTLDSPFDYAKNTVLYLPAHMPDVTKGDYPRAFMDETVKLLNLSKGRALVLFTSIARLKEVSRELQDKIPWPVMVQYEDTKANLLDRFKNNVNSVLLATSSFWQGIDVPGESLSVVIIDRLPFEPPSLPLFKGRERLLRERGLSPFYAYSLPQMLLTLRQGLGRLLRSSTDRGVLAIFDNRAASARYAKTIQKSLPPSHQAKKLSDLEGFLSSL